MNSSYNTNEKRDAKRLALNKMYDDWISFSKKKRISVGVFNPSVTCLDLDVAVEKGLIDSDTKLIFFENFKYLKNKSDRSEFLFKQEVMKHIPIVSKENVFFHFGELETLQLGGALMSLNAQEVDFMFIDLCGELKYSHAKWIYDNRFFIEDGSYQFYTISLQSGARRGKGEKALHLRGIVNPEKIKNRIAVIDNCMCRVTKNIGRCASFWNFICNRLLDTSIQICDGFDTIVYSSGHHNVTKMGIFHGCCNRKAMENYRWEFNMSFLNKDSVEKREDVIVDGVLWDDKRNNIRNFTDGEIKLFRDMPISNDTSKHRYQEMIDYILRGVSERRKNYDRICTKAEVVFPGCYPPEVRDKRYKSSILTYRRGEMLLNRFMLNKEFCDTFDGKKYKFIKNGTKFDLILEKDSHNRM